MDLQTYQWMTDIDNKVTAIIQILKDKGLLEEEQPVQVKPK